MHSPVARSILALSTILSIAEITIRLAVIHDTPAIPYSEIQIPYFLADAHSFYLFPWTLFTAVFCGRRPLMAALHIALMAYPLHYFERAWGSRSLGKYVLLTSIVPVLAAIVADLLLGLGGPIGGSSPLVIALLVALKQANPFTYTLGPLQVKPRYLVMPMLIFYTLFAYWDFSVLVMAWTSLGVSWWYLRYIKSLVMDQLLDGPQVQKGDQSDSFAFATFFYPHQLSAAVDKVTTLVHDSFGKRLVKRSQAPLTDEQRQRALGEQLLSGN